MSAVRGFPCGPSAALSAGNAGGIWRTREQHCAEIDVTIMLAQRPPWLRRFRRCSPFQDEHSECDCAEVQVEQTAAHNADTGIDGSRFPYGAQTLTAVHARCGTPDNGSCGALNDCACPVLAYAGWHAADSRNVLEALRHCRKSYRT